MFLRLAFSDCCLLAFAKILSRFRVRILVDCSEVREGKEEGVDLESSRVPPEI